MYTYKIRVSINKDSKKYKQCNENLIRLIKSSELEPLGNNEYGTDDFSEGMAVISVLGKQAWFLDNAKELIWFNGEELDVVGDYYTEDSLKFYLNKRARCG